MRDVFNVHMVHTAQAQTGGLLRHFVKYNRATETTGGSLVGGWGLKMRSRKSVGVMEYLFSGSQIGHYNAHINSKEWSTQMHLKHHAAVIWRLILDQLQLVASATLFQTFKSFKRRTLGCF